MILDIDRAESVTEAVEAIAWFDIRKLYKDLKDGHETDSGNFWNISDCLLKTISSGLSQPSVTSISSVNGVIVAYPMI